MLLFQPRETPHFKAAKPARLPGSGKNDRPLRLIAKAWYRDAAPGAGVRFSAGPFTGGAGNRAESPGDAAETGADDGERGGVGRLPGWEAEPPEPAFLRPRPETTGCASNRPAAPLSDRLRL